MFEAKITNFNQAVLDELDVASKSGWIDIEFDHDEDFIYITFDREVSDVLTSLDIVTNKSKKAFDVEIIQWVEYTEGIFKAKAHSTHEFFPDEEEVA